MFKLKMKTNNIFVSDSVSDSVDLVAHAPAQTATRIEKLNFAFETYTFVLGFFTVWTVCLDFVDTTSENVGSKRVPKPEC